MAAIMMDSEYFKKIITTAILLILLVLSFLILKPILLSIIMGLIMAMVFSPAYDWIHRKTKLKSVALILICLFLILIIVLPFWFLLPIFVKQSFEIYVAAQKIDFVDVFTKIFPSLNAEEFTSQFGSVFSGFVTRSLNSFVTSVSGILLNFPIIFLHLVVVFATFFFVLKDKDEILNYLKGLMPFSKDVERKLFQSSTDITLSVVYGQVVIGVIQGLIAGLGFLIFGVPNMIFLTLIAVLAGILPIVGPTIIWIPVVIYLLIAGNGFAAAGVTFFGIISAVIDNILRPFFVSKSAKMHPLLSLTGMIGGFLFFGILGFIIGPLILAYVIIILEIYRGKELQGFFLKAPES
ncbi:AI-2E family transporter [Candidatus Pacearchaeota archaeon]|nr:AI-2E family transporter [Candidatus Pacearchaeota archaeon]